MATTTELVQQLYIAYYGRPADPGGLVYWVSEIEANGLNNVINAFFSSDESKALYGETANPEDQINALYQNLLGRSAEPEGLNFWLNSLENGLDLGSLSLEILGGAQNEDAQLINNKLAIAQQFTQAVEAGSIPYNGNSAAAIGRALIEQVTADEDGNNLSQDRLDAFLNTSKVASENPERFETLINESGRLTDSSVIRSDLTVDDLPAPTPEPAPSPAPGPAPTPTFTVTESGTAPNVAVGFQNAGATITVVETAGKLVFTSGSTSWTTTADAEDIAQIQIASGTLSGAADLFNGKKITGAGSLTLTGQSTIVQVQGVDFDGVNGNVTYSIQDTWANISNVANAAIVAGADAYAITDIATAFADVAIADLPTVEEQALIDNASNEADYVYSLSDTLANIIDPANADVVTGATSYSLTDAVLDLGTDQTVAAIKAIDTTDAAAIVAGAQNDPALTLDVQYTLEDSAANLAAVADTAVVAGATAITVTGTPTIAEIQAIVDNGATLADITYTLTNGDVDLGELAIADVAAAQAAAQAIVDGAANVPAVTLNDSYSISDTLQHILQENFQGSALLAGATSIAIGDATSTLDSEVITLTDVDEVTAGTAVDFVENAATMSETELKLITDPALNGWDLALTAADAITVTHVTATNAVAVAGELGNTGTIDDSVVFAGNAVTLSAADFATVIDVADTTAGDTITVNGTPGIDTINGAGQAAKLVINAAHEDDIITGGLGDDTIDGGAGADVMTGGAGADTFVFAAGASGLPTAANFDTIVDFGTGADVIDFGATVLSVDAGTGLTPSVGATAATGLYVVADYANLTAFVTDLANSTTTVAGSTLAYDNGTDTYLFISDGTAGLGANDVLVQLTGVTGLAVGATIDGGDITAFA